MADRRPFDRRVEARESAAFRDIIKTRTGAHYQERPSSPLCLYLSTEVDEAIFSIAFRAKKNKGEREEIHKKTFTKWMNSKLAKASPPVVVHDLVTDLRDGHVLISLLEVLLNTKLTREKGRMRVHILSNLKKALTVLEKNGVKIVGISNYDIADGKVTPILGLVWSIVLRFQVQEIMNESETTVKDFSVEKKLLSWCEDTFDGYEDVVRLRDFTHSWRDGLAFNAIIHAHRPELFEFDVLLNNDNKTNLEHAFDKANEEFAVPKLLDPSDIDVSKPDKKLIMMYLTSLYDGLQGYKPTKTRKEMKLKVKLELEAYRTAHSEVTLYMTQVEAIVSSKLDLMGGDEDPREEYQVAKDLIRDITNHKTDVVDVIHKGRGLVNDGKINSTDQTEITNELVVIEHRWEKLTLLVSRLNKRCHSALLYSKQQHITFYTEWIRRMTIEMKERGQAHHPDEIRRELEEQEEAITEIEQKQPEIDNIVSEVNALCSDEGLGEEDQKELEQQLSHLVDDWDGLRRDALEKEVQLQEAVVKLSPARETVTVTLQSNELQSPIPIELRETGRRSPSYNVEVRRFELNVPELQNKLTVHIVDRPVSPTSEAKQKQKMLSWKRKHREAREVISECEVEVKKLRLELDPQQVHKRLEECDEKLMKADPMVIDATDHGQKLLRDTSFHEKDKEELENELESLVSDYDDMLKSVDGERDRVLDHLNEVEAKKRQLLDDWEHAQEELKAKISRLVVKLEPLKRRQTTDRSEFREYAPAVEACRQEVTSLEPEVSAAMDDGNGLLRGGQLDEKEKSLVYRDMQGLEGAFEVVKDTCADLQQSLEELFKTLEMQEKDSEKEKKLAKWDEHTAKLRKLLQTFQGKLDDVKTSGAPANSREVEEKIELISSLSEEIVNAIPEIQSGYEYGNVLLEDDSLNDDSKDKIESEMEELGEGFKQLKTELDDEHKRLESFLEERQQDNEGKLNRWVEERDKLTDLLHQSQHRSKDLQSQYTPTTREEIEHQISETEEFLKMMGKSFPRIKQSIDYGNDLLSDDDFNEEEKDNIEKEVDELEGGFREVKRDVQDHYGKLKSLLDQAPTTSRTTVVVVDIPGELQAVEYLTVESTPIDDYLIRIDDITPEERREAEKDKKRDGWKDWKDKLDDLLDRLKRKLNRAKSRDQPRNRWVLQDQIHNAKECKEELEDYKPKIREAMDYANDLLDDDDLDDAEKDEIRRYMSTLEIQLITIHKETDEEKNRLDVLLDGTPHPDTVVVEEHLVKEEPIDPHFHKRPYWRVEFKDEVETKVPVQKESIHEYILRLHGDMTPQERRESEKEEKHDRWRYWKEELDYLRDRLKRKLDRAKSRKKPRNRKDLQDQQDEAKECKEELVDSEPKIREAMDYANDLLDDDDLDDAEKDEIRRYMSTLEIQLITIHKETDEEKNRLDVLLDETPLPDTIVVEEHLVQEEPIDPHFHKRPYWRVEFKDEVETKVPVQKESIHEYILRLHGDMTPQERRESEKEEKHDRWRYWKEELDYLRDRLKRKLDRAKSRKKPRNRKDLQDQQDEVKECKEELVDSEPKIREAMDYANDLLDDDDLDDAEKDEIRRYMSTLEIQLITIHKETDEENNRLDVLLDETPLPDTIVVEEHLVQEEPIDPHFHKRPYWRVEFKDEVETKVPVQKESIHEYILRLHGDMTPQERRESEKEEKHDRWRYWKEELDYLRDRLKRKLDRAKSRKKPRNRKDLQDQQDEVKECKEELVDSEPKIREAMDYANDLLDDDDLDDAEKDEIRRYMSTLEIQLITIHKETDEENNRLDVLLDETPLPDTIVVEEHLVQEEPIDPHFHKRPYWRVEFKDEVETKVPVQKESIHEYILRLHGDMTPQERRESEKEEKHDRWRYWKEELDYLRDRLKRKLDRAKSRKKPRNRKDLQDQQDEVKECKEELVDSEPKIREAMDYANDLLDDDDLDDAEKDEIRRYMSTLEIQLITIHKETDEENNRLDVLLDETPLPDTIVVEEHLVQEEPIDPYFHKRPYWRVEFKDEVETKVPVQKESIHEYILRLHGDTTPQERREAEKEEKRDRWKYWKDELDYLRDRLKRKLDRVESRRKPRNQKDLQDQQDEAKECKEELVDSEPKIREAMDYANYLLDEDDLDDAEKDEIRRYISTLRIQLVTINKEADGEKFGLDVLLDETSHPVVVEEDLVQEEPIDPHFHKRPYWRVEFKDEDETKVPVERESIHEYILRLHGDLTPQERREAEKEEERDRWRTWKDKLDDLLDRLNRKLNRAKSKQPPRNKWGIQEQRDDAKECKEEIEDTVPKVREAIDCANDLLDDDDLDKSEKDEIRRYISTLEIRLRTIHQEADDESIRLDELLDKTPHPREIVSKDLANEEPIHRHFRERPDWDVIFHDEVHSPDKDRKKERQEKEKRGKLDRWKNWRYKIDDLLDRLKGKLKRVKSKVKPKNKKELEELKDLAKECKNDLDNSEPEIREALHYANDLLDNDDLDDAEKDEIRRYISTLEIQLITIRREAQAEEDRLDGVADDADIARKEKLDRWADHRDKLIDILNNSKEQLADIKSKETPRKREEIEEQLARTDGFLDELTENIPEIQQSFEYGRQLLDDDDISDDDKDIVDEDIKDLGQAFQELKYDVDEHQKWLKGLEEKTPTVVVTETLIDLKRVEVVHAELDVDRENERRAVEKEKKLGRWKNWRDKLDDLIDKLKNKLNRAKSRDKPRDRTAMLGKKHEAKECKEEVERAEPEIREALDYANDLLDNDDLDDAEKDEIRRYISTLEVRLRRIKKEAVDEEESLDIQLRQHDVEKKGKLDKWKKWKDKIRALLDKYRNKLDKAKKKETPKSRKNIDDQLAITKECEEGLQSSDPEIKFALEYGYQLADDDVLDDDEQKVVKNDADQLEKELAELRDEAANERQRLYVAVHQLDSQKIDTLNEWDEKKRTSRLLLERMRTKVGAFKFKLKPRNKEEIEKRLTEVKDCDDEIESVETEVVSCATQGYQLIADGMLDDTDKVKDDIDELLDDLNNLKKQTAHETNTLESRLEEEEAIRVKKLKRYRNWRKEIQDLLDNLRGKLKRLPKTEKDFPKNEEDRDECMALSKECSHDLKKCEEEVNGVVDYGKGLLDDDLSDDERAIIEKDLKVVSEEFLIVKKDTGDKRDALLSMFKPISDDDTDDPVMVEWHERVRRVNYGLDVAEKRLDDEEEPKTKQDILEKLDEIKELNIGFSETEPQFLDTVDLGKELVTDDAISDKNRLRIKDDILWMAERWHELRNRATDKEQRLEGVLASNEEQSEELVAWHEKCDNLQAWIDDMLALLETRPLSPSQTFGVMKKQQSVAEDVVHELMDKQVEVNDVIDDGNKLLDDTSCGIEERHDIHDKMSNLHSDWSTLSITVSNRQENIQDKMVKLEQQHKDMLASWKKRYGPLMLWIAEAETRLNKEFAIAPDLDTVKKQREQIKKFEIEKHPHQRDVSETLGTADHLMKDPQINEEEKTVIQKEMLELKHRWEELDESVNWKQNRIEDTIRKLENQQEDKLRKWQEGLHEVNTWIIHTSVKIKPEPTMASDVDSAYDQIDSFQDMVRDAPIYQDKVTNLNEFSSNLVTDSCLGEEERQKVRREMADCNEEWNELVNIANVRQSKFDQNLNKLEQEQDNDFNRWTTRSGRASELLDKFEADMPTLDEPVATQLEEVEKQDQEFDVFVNQVIINETQVKDTFALGEEISKDAKYAKSKRDSVQGQLNLLVSRWDRVQDFVDLRKGRLEETAKRLRVDRKDKFDRWKTNSQEIDVIIGKTEKDFRASDSIGDDFTTVKRQEAEFRNVAKNILNQKRKVHDFDRYTDKLTADPVMDDVSRHHMKIEKDARMERWNGIVDNIDKHKVKLGDKLLNLEEGQAELSNWRKQLVIIQQKVTRLEKVCGKPEGKDLNTVEKQKEVIKDAVRDADILDPQVSEFLSSSEDMMDKSGISSTDRRTIDNECAQLETRWHEVKNELGRNEKSVDERRDSLVKRLKYLLIEWESKKSAISKWIADMEVRVKNQDIPVPDLDHARAQNQEIEDIRKEIFQYDKQVRDLEDFGGAIIDDPSMRQLEQKLVTNEKESLKSRWNALNKNTKDVQKKLDDKIEELEKEQREKLKTWKAKTDPLNRWLADTESTVESYDPIGYDIKMVKEQGDETQEMINEFLIQQPKFAEARDFGNVLTTDPCVGLEERVALQEQMTSQHEQWDSLYGLVTSRHDEIQDRLKILEEEEEDRIRKEELERKKREDDRKRKEEERKRLEEEERRARAEEEKRKRDEEKRDREEEERKRKEEAEKKRKEEEKRKREEQERKKQEEEKRKKEAEKKKRDERKRKEEAERQRQQEAEDNKRKEEAERQLQQEAEDNKRKEEEERKKKEEKDKEYFITQMAYEPRVAKLEEESHLYSSPYDEEIITTEEPLVEGVEANDQWTDPFTEAENESRRKLAAWRDDADEVRKWTKEQNFKLKDESDDEDIRGLKEQRKEILHLEKELRDFEPKYEKVKRTYKDLTKDEFLHEDDHKAMAEEMDDVNLRWDNMYRLKDTKRHRLEDKIQKEENQKLDELIKCRAELRNFKDWIAVKNDEFDKFSPIADDLPTVIKQKSEMKVFSKVIVDHESKFFACTETADKLSHDPALSEDESHVIQGEIEDCEERWDTLNEKVKVRVDSLVAKLPGLQKKQKELLDDWGDKYERFEKSVKKADDNLKDQKKKGHEGVSKFIKSPDLTNELNEKVEHNENIVWRQTVDDSNNRLSKLRIKLQRIQRDKKNRKWSMLEAIKEVFGFSRRDSKSTLQLDKLIELMEDHEDLMQEVSSLQRPANDVFYVGNTVLNGSDVDEENVSKVDKDMRAINSRWNLLNVGVIQRENTLQRNPYRNRNYDEDDIMRKVQKTGRRKKSIGKARNYQTNNKVS